MEKPKLFGWAFLAQPSLIGVLYFADFFSCSERFPSSGSYLVVGGLRSQGI